MTIQPFLPWPVLVVVTGMALGVTVGRLRSGDRPLAPVLRSSAMIALIVAISLDPAVAGGQVAAIRADANVLFVVDTTGSMAAEDFDGGRPRLDAVRADIMSLVGAFPGAHFSVITFDSKSRIVLPWTTDIGAVDTAVSLLRQERTMYARGSRLDLAVPTMARSLPRADEDGGGGYDVVFFISDGEQTADASTPSLGALRRAVSAGAVLGYGTSDGGRMRLYTGREAALDQYLVDNETGEEAVSRIDEDTLVALAADLGVAYLHRTEPGGLDRFAGEVADGARKDLGGVRDGDRRLYWIAAFGLVALALWQMSATALEIAEARRAIGGRTRRLRQ